MPVSEFCAVTVTPGKGMLPLFTVPCNLPPATAELAAGAVAWGAAAGSDAGDGAGAPVEFGAAAGFGVAAWLGAAAGTGACAQAATQLATMIPATPARIIIFAVRPLVPVFSLTSQALSRFTEM